MATAYVHFCNFKRLVTTTSYLKTMQSAKRHLSNGSVNYQKVLTLDTMNPNIKKVEYAVRGPIVVRAGGIRKELEQVST